ncbi:MAG TPA: GDSL-type esterase/lipase family protein [Ktedonobacterales bacterium]
MSPPHQPRWRRHALPPRLLARSCAVLCALALLAACGAPSTSATSSTSAAPLAPAGQAAPAGTITYVALGASDAFGVGTDDPDRQNWPNDLAGELGPNIHLINLGLPGATLAQATRDELPIALDAHPNIVTVWLAVNDFDLGIEYAPGIGQQLSGQPTGPDAATYGQQLTSLLATLRQNTTAQVYVANLPDLLLVPYFNGKDPAGLSARVAAWNAVIAAACAREGAHLVDLASAWQDLADHPEYISQDGLHPSTIGAQRLADAFAAAIRQHGGP